MNIYNKFLEDLEHKNRIKNILNDDINDKLLSKNVRKPSLNSLISTRPQLKENIHKIKMKYGISKEVLDQQNLHHQILQLKYKYIKNNTNKYKIFTVNNVNIISNNNTISKKDSYQNYKKKTHSVDYKKVKNYSIPNNINKIMNFEKEKMNFSISSEQLINNNSNMNLNLSNNTYNADKNGKNINYQKYLKNQRNEYNKIEQKIKEILEDEYLSPEKIQKFNNIYPISKRRDMLTDIKKEIKKINNKNDNTQNNFNNSFFSQFSSESYTTVGFNYIKPKIKRPSLYEDTFNKNNDSKNNNFSYNEISKNNELEKPVLIRHLNKPNLKLLHFQNFFENK